MRIEDEIKQWKIGRKTSEGVKWTAREYKLGIKKPSGVELKSWKGGKYFRLMLKFIEFNPEIKRD